MLMRVFSFKNLICKFYKYIYINSIYKSNAYDRRTRNKQFL